MFYSREYFIINFSPLCHTLETAEREISLKIKPNTLVVRPVPKHVVALVTKTGFPALFICILNSIKKNHNKVTVKLNSIELLSLYVYTESEKTISKHAAYLNILPEHYTCPVAWEEDDIRKLPHPISGQILFVRKRLIIIAEQLKLDFERYLWSFCSIFTR